jgi:hypothetical protein
VKSIRQLAVLVSVLGAGCIDAGDDQQGDDSLGTIEQQGVSVNGVSVNGVSVNGVSVNGVSVNGVSVNGVSVNGVSVNGGQITGTTSSGAPLSGTGMIGAKFTGTLATGATIKLRVDGAHLLVADAWGYLVSSSPDGVTWTQICAASDHYAVAIAGKWDYRADVAGAGGWIADSTTFTFGCRGAAIAKCIEMGYRPWATVGGTLLRDHHTACVRMIRGDYCGNGHAWTQDGNLINIYDMLGIQADAQLWPLDASWGAAGAKCARKVRSLNGKPTCFATLKDCPLNLWEAGVLMVDEFAAN